MENLETKKPPELTKKDLTSDQMVRWCPGCGDYVILNALKKALVNLNHPKENIVCVSGIGCSSRLPYYLDTYGIHSLHGRAAATASGVKLANPELNVWVVTGDGDCMAIGGNHFIHAIRRNINLNIVIFNNKIYGMTKGQASPTTPEGTKTKTSPEGTYERPFNAGELAIGSQGTFFARVPDNQPKLLEEVLTEASKHDGTSVVEVLQNCVIFTDKIHEEITGKDSRDDNQLILEHGKPMIFGKHQTYGLRVNSMKLEKVAIDDEQNIPDDILVHNVEQDDPALHLALTRMQLPDFPVAMGIIRRAKASVFDQKVHEAITAAKGNSRFNNVTELINSGNTWTI